MSRLAGFRADDVTIAACHRDGTRRDTPRTASCSQSRSRARVSFDRATGHYDNR
jgi:hypothetical protein